jgi:hypothetical protein
MELFEFPLKTGAIPYSPGRRLMEAQLEVLSINKNTRSLKGLFNPCDGNLLFEVKVRDKKLYSGESFEEARMIYEKLCRDEDSESKP